MTAEIQWRHKIGKANDWHWHAGIGSWLAVVSDRQADSAPVYTIMALSQAVTVHGGQYATLSEAKQAAIDLVLKCIGDGAPG